MHIILTVNEFVNLLSPVNLFTANFIDPTTRFRSIEGKSFLSSSSIAMIFLHLHFVGIEFPGSV